MRTFGRLVIESGQVFAETALSYAFVNLKPTLPGHVLVTPSRVCLRLAELNRDELLDLFTLVQRVGNAVESVHGARPLTVSIQDGPDAGQTVPVQMILAI